MKHPAFIIAATTIVVLGTGCVSPQSGTSGSRFIQYTDPIPNGYFTGEIPDFGTKQTLDPMNRKFRVAYLQVFATRCEDFASAAKVMEEGIKDDVASQYMALREQAADSHARKFLTPQMYEANKSVAQSGSTFINVWLANSRDPRKLYTMSSPVEHAFLADYPSEGWLAKVNADLAAKYPNLFSNDSSAWPIDLVMEVIFDGTGQQRTYSLYEAWILGLPEHALITFGDTVNAGAIFKAQRGFVSPLDAIAAALLKLSPEQWEGLEPANPNDHSWLQ